MDPLVSILIPAYNAERWVADTLESALRQTWKNTEIILVDDGSTDATLPLARRFESRGVRVVAQSNQGASAARNHAYSLSRGEYIQWLDADDLLAPDKIERQLTVARFLPGTRTLISGPWGRFMFHPGRVRFCPGPLWHDLSPVEWHYRKLSANAHMQPATWLVSRELTEAAGPWDTRLTLDDDGEYFCRVVKGSAGIQFVSAARVYYRMAGFNSLSAVDRSSRKLDSLLLSMRAHIDTMLYLEDSLRSHAACLTYLHTWVRHFHPVRPDMVAELEKWAVELGGRLDIPPLSWKYTWIRCLMGWDAARRAQEVLPRIRWTIHRAMDRTLFSLASASARTIPAGSPSESHTAP